MNTQRDPSLEILTDLRQEDDALVIYVLKPKSLRAALNHAKAYFTNPETAASVTFCFIRFAIDQFREATFLPTAHSVLK